MTDDEIAPTPSAGRDVEPVEPVERGSTARSSAWSLRTLAAASVLCVAVSGGSTAALAALSDSGGRMSPGQPPGAPGTPPGPSRQQPSAGQQPAVTREDDRDT